MSQTFELHQPIFETIAQRLAAQEYHQAANLIDQQSEVWMRNGQVATIDQALRQLPHSIVQQNLGLCLWSGWVHTLIGEEEAAEYWIEQAEQRCTALFPTPENQSSAQLQDYQYAVGQILTIQAVLAQRKGKRTMAVAHCTLALAMLPANSTALRTIATLIHTIAQSDLTDHEVLISTLHALRRTAYATAQPFILISILMYEAMHLFQHGQLHAAFQICQRTLAYAEGEQHQALACLPQLRLGQLAYYWNDLTTAQYYLNQGVAMPRAEFALATIDGYITLARIHIATNQIDQAYITLQTAEQFAHMCGRHSACAQLQAWVARLHLVAGNTAAAINWATQTGYWNKHTETLMLANMGAEQWLTFCRLLITLRDPTHIQQAEQLLRNLLQHAQHQQLTLIQIETGVVLARLYAVSARGERAIATLASVLVLVETSSALRLMIDEGRWIGSILQRLATSGALHQIAQRILQALPRDHSSFSHALFSTRELAILQLLAEGHSNADIAQYEQLATSTVQWYLKQIYHKLEVHNRTQAAIRARELNLLSSAIPPFSG
jgi:LuxR family transcriptional regulator, maltose regulon positive regulatory protein